MVAIGVFLAALLSMPVALAGGQEQLSSSLEPRKVAAGERFELVIRATDLPDAEELSVEDLSIKEPLYPESIDRMAGPSIVEIGASGPQSRRVEITIPFRATDPGRMVIEPIRLEDDRGNTWQTERHLVEVTVSESEDTIPFDVAWNTPVDRIYEGQTIPLYLEIERATSFAFPDRIDVDPPEDAVFEEVQGLGSVASEVVSGVEILRYPIATFLLTPQTDGEVVIPPAEVGASARAGRAEALTLDVRPLPEEVRETLAVGSYRFSVELSEHRLTEGEAAVLTLRAEGTGNLDFFRFPEVDAGEIRVGTAGEHGEVAPVPRGLVGSREQRLRIAPEEPGEHQVTVEPFTWLDPETGEIGSDGPHRFTLEVRPAEASVAEAREDIAFDPLTVDQIRRMQPWEMYRIPAFYLLFLPPVVAVVLTLAGFSVRRGGMLALLVLPLVTVLLAATPPRELPREELERSVAALEEDNLAEALWRLRRMEDEYPRSPGILYNLGYASYLADERAGTVYALREALRIRPMFRQAGEALQWVEEQYELDRQVQHRARVHPDVALTALFVLAYLLTGLLIRMRRRGGARHAIGFISTVLFLFGAVVLMVYAMRTSAVPTAVVETENAVLTQVPVAEAEQWLSLPAGTAVRPLETYGGYRLVRTGFGVEGWIDDNDLMVSKP
ncbi:MAG: hypothetical protein ACLFRR_06755 [Spirochaetaceae bacterium]